MPKLRSVCRPCVVLVLCLFFRCAPTPSETDIDFREDRKALFDDLVKKTLERESFSPVKNRILNLDVIEEMRKYRDELIRADTDEKLFYALLKISNARKDRHLDISLVR